MDNGSDRLDPLLEQVVESLRAPVDLTSDLDQRIMRDIRRGPRRRSALRPILLGAGLALAAGIAGLLLSRGPTRSPAGDQSVTFALKADSAAVVSVVGDFNQRDPESTPLIRGTSGTWSVTLSLPPGRYRFSFLLDGRTWRADPGRPPVPDPDFQIPTSLVQVGSSL